MFGSAVLLGLSALAAAAPVQDCYGPDSGQVPFTFPLANGFPNVAIPSDALTQIQRTAQGTLPNGGLPANVSANSAEAFKIVAFNEIFEVAYFNALINNITNNVPGYAFVDDASKQSVLKKLNAIQAQEQLHALGANAILATNNVAPIQACQYVFPVTTFNDAIALASTFTDVVLGTLQSVDFNLGINRDTELLGLLTSIVGQEGEQDGYFRTLIGKIPSALPFLTAAAGPFAASVLLQDFVVPGSCGNLNTINVAVFPALSVDSANITLADQTLNFSFHSNDTTDGLSVVYINQQNTPVTTPLTNVQKTGDLVSFSAQFPGDTNLMNGLTLVAVTNSAGPFSGAEAVAAATKFGPGIIEIN
ncbi:hypothetical protein AMS68_004019 [Peltaster fructicola]|uniref:Sexual development protein n=1 Tax=Peltaster fructicola TaxID=286661 RepID=A0A6H0XUS2_9PEZI|nr:hypothetical protein AMS68_004019 [Peltaster fructicola]